MNLVVSGWFFARQFITRRLVSAGIAACRVEELKFRTKKNRPGRAVSRVARTVFVIRVRSDEYYRAKREQTESDRCNSE